MLLGKYEVLKPIGVGGFGRVVLARTLVPGPNGSRLVAIKRLRSSKAQRKGTEESFKNEGLIGQSLSHPNVVRVFEFIHQGRDLIMVMEYIMGLGVDEMLGQLRLRTETMPPDVALEITRQAAAGLHHAHTAVSPTGEPLHIVHRDVKPSNIMVGRDGVVKVMDFGVARWSQPRVNTTTGTIKGTLRYLSPEQARGSREIGPACDQFALGLVLGEMLIGRPVYDAEQDHKVLLKALRVETRAAVAEADSRCPGVGDVLTRCFTLEPGDRYPSLLEFRDALANIKLANPSGLNMAEWVHLGLEERARLAADDPDAFLPPDSIDNTQDDAPPVHTTSAPIDAAARREAEINRSAQYAMGWIHDHLPYEAESGNISGGSSGSSSSGEWVDLIADPDGQPIIARRAEEGAGWAMVPNRSDEHDYNLLRREPVSDEWAMSDSPELLEKRTRSVTDLSAEMLVSSNESLDRIASGELRNVIQRSRERTERASQVNTAELLLSFAQRDPDSDDETSEEKSGTAAAFPRFVSGSSPDEVDFYATAALGPLFANDLEGNPAEASASGPGIEPYDALTSAEPSPTLYSVKRPGSDRVSVRRRPKALRFSPTPGTSSPEELEDEAQPDAEEDAGSEEVAEVSAHLQAEGEAHRQPGADATAPTPGGLDGNTASPLRDPLPDTPSTATPASPPDTPLNTAPATAPAAAPAARPTDGDEEEEEILELNPEENLGQGVSESVTRALGVPVSSSASPEASEAPHTPELAELAAAAPEPLPDVLPPAQDPDPSEILAAPSLEPISRDTIKPRPLRGLLDWLIRSRPKPPRT